MHAGAPAQEPRQFRESELAAVDVHAAKFGAAMQVGNTLPGLSRPCASNAHFSRCCWLRSISLNISGIRCAFRCRRHVRRSETPPSSTQTRKISAPKASAAPSRQACWHRTGSADADCRRRLKHIGDAQIVLCRQVANSRQGFRQFAARDGAVHAEIISEIPSTAGNAALRPARTNSAQLQNWKIRHVVEPQRCAIARRG